MRRLAGRARANALANVLANAFTRASDLADDLDNADEDPDNAEILVGTLARANALANARALNLDHTLDLERALNHSRDLAHALTRASDFTRVRVCGSHTHTHLAREFAHALVRDLAGFDPAAHWARAVVADGTRRMPGR